MTTSPNTTMTRLPAGQGDTPKRIGTPLRSVLIVGSLVILLILLGTAATVLQTRSHEIDDSRRELATLNTVLAEEASRTAQSVDLVLTALLNQLEAEGIETEADFRRLKAGPETYELLKSKISGLPQLDALSFIGADGKLVNFSRFFPIPPVDVSDRDYFAALSREPSTRAFLSTPVENRGTGSWTVYLARRISGRDGAFLGLVLAAIDLRYFDDFYRSLNLERGMAVGIWRRDGVLLARQPPMKGIGRSFTTPAFGSLSSDLSVDVPPLVYETSTAIDGRARLVSRRAVADYPLVVVVSRTMAQVLADWRRQAIVLGIAACLASLAIVVVMAALARQFGAYEALARAVREREAAILAREEAESQLRQMQKLEAMGQLTSGVAHDFNNFLTVVIGNLQLLARRLEERGDEQLSRLIGAALAGADRAAALTKQLLAFSRRQELEPQSVEVNGLVAGMSDILRHTLGDRGRITLSLAPALWPAFADPNQLESALLNLVVNSRDAMPQGGRIEIATRNVPAEGERPARIELAVSDTGTGMSAEVAGRAFEPFFTTKGPGIGTGLGLAQVYGFVRQSHGDIAIESEPGQGTRVSLLLPRSPGWHEPQAAQGTSPALASSGGPAAEATAEPAS